MLKRKRLLICIFIVLIMVLVIFIFSFYYIRFRGLIGQCPGIDLAKYNKDTSLVNCFGIISIDKSFESGISYRVRDFRHDYDVATLNNLNDFKFKNSNLYVIDRSQHVRIDSNNPSSKYFVQFYKAGAIKTFYYDTQDEIPKYLLINTISGEVTLFKTTIEMPEDDRKIFEELEEVK